MSYKLLYNGEPDLDLNADIWFVHGLRGDAMQTWTKGSTCWPKDLLKHDTKDCRIFTWSYDSQVANITTSASHATIFGHAESFLQDIAMTRESSNEAERPLVFVGHSLGGLVIKEALIRSSEYLFNQQDKELGAIYAATKGVVFLGTPHRGSDKTPYGHVVAKVAKAVWRQPNEHLISLLEKESAILEKQRKSFASISKDFSLVCLYEELPTKIGIIVPEWSAVIDGFNVKQHPLPGDHVQMCKFADSEEAGYKRVSYMIKTILKKEFQARQEIMAVMVHDLLFSLRFASMYMREDGLDDAHNKTFEWFLKDKPPPEPSVATLKEWLWSGESMFWMSGKAGCGKSTLMKYATTSPEMPKILEVVFEDKRRLVASHYLFERGKDPLQKSREGLLRHLLHQLVDADPALALPIFKQLKAVRSFDPDKNWTWKELRTALELALGAIPPDTIVLLFIDGLDEYRAIRKLEMLDLDDEDEDMDTQLAEVITDGHQEIADLMRSLSKKSNVRLCVSSRPLLVFKDSFARCRTIELHTKTAQDIKQYVSDQLAGNPLLAQLTILEPTFEEDVKSEILAKADGVFLWVKLVMGLIIRGLKQRDTVDELLFKLRFMPKELGGKNGLYMAMLRMIALEKRREGFEYFQILQKSQVDLDPLFVSFATDDEEDVFTVSMSSIGLDEINARRTRTAERLLTRCGGLLAINAYGPYVTVNFIHQTAKEFVSKRSNWESLLGSNIPKSFDGSLALQRAAVMLLKRSRPLHEGWKAGDCDEVWARLMTSLMCASLTDANSSEKSARLVLLADRVMFNMYRPRELCDYSLTDFPSSSMFSSSRRGEDPGPSLGELSSHLRPCNADLSKISPLRRHHWSVMEPGALDIPRGKDLMAVAVQCNLFSFLEIMSQRRDVTITSPQEYPLIAYGVVPYRTNTTLVDESRLGIDGCDPDVTLFLLQAGETPNQQYTGPSYYKDCTVWQGFLIHGDLLFEMVAWEASTASKEGNFAKFGPWVENAKLLMEWGADVNISCSVSDRRLLIQEFQLGYRHRSALFIMTTILWRAARSQGWRKDALQLMTAKGAKLKAGEKEELLDLADMLKIPQPLVRSVSEIVLESRDSDSTDGNVSLSGRTSNRRFLAPFLRPESASTSQMGGLPSGRTSSSSFQNGGPGPGPGSDNIMYKWRRRRTRIEKRLKELFLH